MKLNYKQSMMIVGGIGVLFVLFGIAQAIFKFPIDKKVSDQVTLVLGIIAVFFFFNGKKARNQDEVKSNSSETSKPLDITDEFKSDNAVIPSQDVDYQSESEDSKQ